MNRILFLHALFATAGLLLFGVTPLPAEITLTNNGTPSAVIVLGDSLRPSDVAVRALVSHVKQMSGATLPVLAGKELASAKIEGGRITPSEGSAKADTFILLGEGEISKRAGFSLEGLGAGGIVVQTKGNAIALLAKDDGSDNHTPANARPVFAFLEALGCRCLWPGESGKVVPKRDTITVPDLNTRFTPPIGQRRIRMVGLDARGTTQGLEWLGVTAADQKAGFESASRTESEGTWAAWNGLGGNIGVVGGAAGCGLRGGWDEHGRAHPEWFALQADGTRDQSNAKERWRLCVSNPGLIDHVAQDIIARLGGHAQPAISLCPNDGGFSSFCMCEECRKLDAPDGPKVTMLIFDKVGEAGRKEVEYVSLTDRYVHYWNAVAERVTKVVPDQLFLVEAYSYYSDPPVHAKLHPNLVVRYVPGEADGWKGWQDAGAKRVYWRPNSLGSGYRDGVISSRPRSTAATINLLAKQGILATDMDSIFNNWSTHGLHYYVAARLSWNPALQFETVLDDFCRSGFGAGAEHVKKYFLLADTGVQMRKVGNRGIFPLIAPETITAMREVLTAAAKVTETDPPAHRRVAFLRTGFEFTALSAEAYRLKEAAEAGAKPDPATVNAVMERRWQLMRAILTNDPLAVNVAVVTANDGPLNSALGWKGPTAAGKAGKFPRQPGDDWLNEDQSATRK